ncbi:hypothetical protein [Phenylobacterium sp.]|uniref:hypothetical protein n=1 Tax=Phenylobacterium sp. TaxID=1871053 RepID=UPI0025CC0BF4|nr:hypothetical protein [Phenylobacterium sp.]
MIRALLLVGLAALAAGTAHAQLVEIEATRTTPASDPILARVGQTISSHISEVDQYWLAPARSYELIQLQGKAGQTVNLRLKSDIPTISMSFGADFGLRKTVFQPGPGQPITYVLPKDGRYWIIVEAKGPQRFGAYQLSIGDGTSAPSFDSPSPAPLPRPTAVAAQGQRVEVTPTFAESFNNPTPVKPGQLIASDLANGAFNGLPGWRFEQFVLTGVAGQTVTLQLQTDIPDLEVGIRAGAKGQKMVVQGPARDAPLRYVLPTDGPYYIALFTRKPQKVGSYLLSIGDGTSAPSFAPPPPAAVQIAQALPPPQPAPGPAEAPAPAVLPKLELPDGITVMDFGQTLSRPAGAKTELYGVIGEAGAVLTAAVTGTGVLGVTIFTPEGAEMLTSGGQGAATLKAVLPKDAVYIFAVTRIDPSRPYRLSLSAESPNLVQWGQRRDAGYEVMDARGALVLWTCWVEPGVSLQYLYADGANLVETLNSAGSGSIERQGSKETFTTRRDGETLVRTMSSGREVRESLASPPPKLGAYRGYRCP